MKSTEIRNRDGTPYRFMPELTSEEEAGLRASIREHGVLQPVLTDERGVIIDGYNRARIADELKVAFESKIVRGLPGESKTDLAFSQNMAKRNLTAQQRRDVIRRYLEVRPEATDRHAASVLGVHHQTVASVRAELHPPAGSNGENDHKDAAPEGTLAAPFYARHEASGRRPRGRQPDSPAERARKAIARRKAQSEAVIESAREAIEVPAQRSKCIHCPVHCPQ